MNPIYHGDVNGYNTCTSTYYLLPFKQAMGGFVAQKHMMFAKMVNMFMSTTSVAGILLGGPDFSTITFWAKTIICLGCTQTKILKYRLKMDDWKK